MLLDKTSKDLDDLRMMLVPGKLFYQTRENCSKLFEVGALTATGGFKRHNLKSNGLVTKYFEKMSTDGNVN